MSQRPNKKSKINLAEDRSLQCSRSWSRGILWSGVWLIDCSTLLFVGWRSEVTFKPRVWCNDIPQEAWESCWLRLQFLAGGKTGPSSQLDAEPNSWMDHLNHQFPNITIVQGHQTAHMRAGFVFGNLSGQMYNHYSRGLWRC